MPKTLAFPNADVEFVIGQYGGGSQNKFVWPEPMSIKKTVWDAIGHLPVAAQSKKFETLHGHVSDKLSALNLERIRAVKAGEGRTSLPENLVAECHRREATKIGHRNVYGRMSWDNVAPPLQQGLTHLHGDNSDILKQIGQLRYMKERCCKLSQKTCDFPGTRSSSETNRKRCSP